MRVHTFLPLRRVGLAGLLLAACQAPSPPAREAASQPRTPPTDFTALADIFRAEATQLCTDPVTAARRLRAMTLALSSPAFFAGAPATPREIVTLLLDGIRVRGRGRPQQETDA